MLLYDIACNIINSKDNNFQNFKLVKWLYEHKKEVIILKKVCLNPLIVYDFFYEKIKNCDDLELIGSDKKA